MDNQKKYLTLSKKLAYGTGDLGSNFFYMLVSSFALIYMTNAVGLNAGVVGTLILASKLLDGVTDVFFGSLIFNPMLVKKFGMYKVNLYSYVVTTIFSLLLMVFTYMANLGGLVVISFLRGISMAFLMGSLNALVAEVAQNNWLKNKVHTEGMMFSCSSIGIKVGGGIGAGMAGWLLAFVHFDGTAAVQSDAVLNMIKFIYGAVPFILTVLITVCLVFMKVDTENRRLEKEKE